MKTLNTRIHHQDAFIVFFEILQQLPFIHDSILLLLLIFQINIIDTTNSLCFVRQVTHLDSYHLNSTS